MSCTPVLEYTTERRAAPSERLARRAVVCALMLAVMDCAIKLVCWNATVDFGWDQKKPPANWRDAVARVYWHRAESEIRIARLAGIAILVVVSTFHGIATYRQPNVRGWLLLLLTWVLLGASMHLRVPIWRALYHDM